MSTALQSTRRTTGADPGGDMSLGQMLRRIYAIFYNKKIGLFLIFAMTALSLIGVLFTQVTAEQFADKEVYDSFLDSVRGKYRGWTTPLSFMGVFHMFSSWPFRLVTIALVLSIIGCTTHRLPLLWRNATAPHTHVREGFFDHARTRHSVELSTDPQQALEAARAGLVKRRFRVLTDDRGDGLNLYADRNRWMPLGTALAHAAFVLILLGVLVTNNTGFRDDEFTVPVGMGPKQVGHDTGLSVQAKSFTDSYHNDGSPMDYAAELVLFKDGKQVLEHTARVNSPMKYDGIKFNQAYFGFAAEVDIADAQGKAIVHDAVPLQYSNADETQNYGRVELPAQGLQVYVIAPASGQVDARIGPGQVQVEVYKADSNEPVAQQVVSQGQPAEVGGLKVTFERERQFTGLMVSQDHGAPLVWTGSLLLVLGTICTMFFKHQRVWLRIHPTASGSQVRMASPDKHDTIFERTMKTFVESLGEPANRQSSEPAPGSEQTLTTSGSTHA
ncbi:hypothetical protein GCM10027030_25400 [Luteococcus sediminum]